MNRFLRKVFIPLGSLFLFSSCQYNSISPSVSDLEPTFENVGMILQTSCSGGNCHVGQRTSGVRLDSYQNVISSEGTQYGMSIVQPRNSNDSPIIDKLEANPQFGNRMPFGRTPLSKEEIGLIKQWIDNGAQND